MGHCASIFLPATSEQRNPKWVQVSDNEAAEVVGGRRSSTTAVGWFAHPQRAIEPSIEGQMVGDSWVM